MPVARGAEPGLPRSSRPIDLFCAKDSAHNNANTIDVATVREIRISPFYAGDEESNEDTTLPRLSGECHVVYRVGKIDWSRIS